MTAIATALREARDAIASASWRDALSRLLDIWRERPVVRIADVIDRVSDRLPHEPIQGKTVKARTAAWLEVAKKKDAADVGALLATPWPGKWQDGVPVMQALEQFPDDPRVARAVAQYVSTTPFDSWACVAFYGPALRIVQRTGDVRTLPLLEAELARTHSSTWERQERPLFEAAHTSIRGRMPDLEVPEREVLVAIEAMFAGDKQMEATNEKSEADFLAAIHAAPDDDDLRAVFADWLTERGDPRGELINLQLSADPGEAAKKRVATLLRKHGRAWAGPFDRVFEKEGRVFVRGFIAGGIIRDSRVKSAASDLAHPEWALIESLTILHLRKETLDGILSAPWLRTLKSIFGIHESMAWQLADGRAPSLESLHFIPTGEVTDEVLEGRRRIARAFPRLKSLGLGQSADHYPTYLAGPFPRGLERFIVTGWTFPLAAVSEAVEIAKLDVPILEAWERHDHRDPCWRFQLERDAKGRWTRLRGSPGDPDLAVPGQSTLETLMRSLPDLTELEVQAGSCEWNRGAIAAMESAIAEMKSLSEVDVPWDREVTRGAAEPRLTVRGVSPDKMGIDAIWDALTTPPISLTFDSIAVNYGGHEDLPADTLGHVKKELAKKRATLVHVYRKRSADTTQLLLRRTNVEMTMPRAADFDLDAWLGWLVGLLDAGTLDAVRAPFFGRDSGGIKELTSYRIGPMMDCFDWIMSFGPSASELYAFDDLAAAVSEISAARAVRAKRHLLLVMSPSPDEMPPSAERERFGARLTQAFWTQFERKRGFLPEDLAARLLGPALERHGFTTTSNTSWVRGEHQRVEFEFGFSHADVWMRIAMSGENARHTIDNITTGGPVSSVAIATEYFDRFIAQLDRTLQFFVAPVRPHKCRGSV